MTRTGIIVEIEELVFDTRDLRADALHAALLIEAVVIDRDTVLRAHAGVPAAIALTRLDAAAAALDDTARELVLHRVADDVRHRVELQAPSFDTGARDALQQLAAEFALGVVTRASHADAMRLLELAELDAFVAVVRSLDGLEADRHHDAWSAVLTRLHADQGVAIAPSALLPAARLAGLRTVAIDVAPRPDAGTPPWDAALDSLARVNSSFIASLT